MLKSDVRIRPIDLATEIERYAELRTRANATLTTPDEIRERLASFGDRLKQDTLVADDGSEIVGMARWARFDHENEGIANLSLAVLPNQEGRGIGSLLYSAIEESSKAFGIKRLFGGGKDSWENLLPFAQKHGFIEQVRYVDSKANLADFHDSLAQWCRNHLTSLGLQIRTPEELLTQNPPLESLYDLFAEADADEPLTPDIGLQSFDHYRSQWGQEAVQKGQVVAAYEGDYCVGYSQTSLEASGEFWTMFTGVRRAWRGKKVAFCLKALLMYHEKLRGSNVMGTANSSLNPAMLAINKKLNFVPGPGWIVLVKDLK